MNFNFGVIAKTVPAIALVGSIAFFVIGQVGFGFLFLIVAIGTFVLMLVARR
jgi:hypothetical protein